MSMAPLQRMAKEVGPDGERAATGPLVRRCALLRKQPGAESDPERAALANRTLAEGVPMRLAL